MIGGVERLDRDDGATWVVGTGARYGGREEKTIKILQTSITNEQAHNLRWFGIDRLNANPGILNSRLNPVLF